MAQVNLIAIYVVSKYACVSFLFFFIYTGSAKYLFLENTQTEKLLNIISNFFLFENTILSVNNDK